MIWRFNRHLPSRSFIRDFITAGNYQSVRTISSSLTSSNTLNSDASFAFYFTDAVLLQKACLTDNEVLFLLRKNKSFEERFIDQVY